MKRNQLGFSAVELFLAIIAVTLIGFVGYYVWHAQQNVDTTLKQSTSVQSTTTKSETKSSATTPQTKYLVISEWGVKLPLNDPIESAYYFIRPNASNSTAYLSLDTLKQTDCAADKTSIGGIVRVGVKDTDEMSGKPYAEEVESFGLVKVGDYYYYYMGPQASCTDDKAIEAKMISARAAFVTQIKQIQAQ